ncbi:MAG: hypothetical protein P8J20_13155 [Novosphingobium sp.]|nr:hypothetical protein [Novosphingobium sp.]
MAKVHVVTPEKADKGALPQGFSGDGEVQTYLEGDKFPLQLHLHRLASGQSLQIGPLPVECVSYVWRGDAEAGGRPLATGSSIIVEQGQTITVKGGADGAQVLAFSSAEPLEAQTTGANVHLLPADQVPRTADLGGHGVKGAMHADSDCPTCNVWLHENRFPPSEPLDEEQQKRGIHSHSEDEIIFVIDGEMRLGNRPAGPGTAIAIAAETLYSFSPGPDGLAFINFRAAQPSEIKFANGTSMSETKYWREALPRPEYLEPVA